jgi:hypothetical protein
MWNSSSLLTKRTACGGNEDVMVDLALSRSFGDTDSVHRFYI